MDKYAETLIYIDSIKNDPEKIVSILLLCANKLDIETVSEMARKENKTPKGIRDSNQYRKIEISKAKFALKGLKENNLPF